MLPNIPRGGKQKSHKNLTYLDEIMRFKIPFKKLLCVHLREFFRPFRTLYDKKNWLHPNRLIHHESWVFSCEIQSTFSLELNPAEEHMQIVDIKIYDRRYWSRPYSSCSKFVGNLTLEILFVKFLHFAFIWWQLWSNQTDICT